MHLFTFRHVAIEPYLCRLKKMQTGNLLNSAKDVQELIAIGRDATKAQ